MEVLPGVYKVGSFITTVQEWFNMQPCLVKEGYRYQVTKKGDGYILITVLKVTEYTSEEIKGFLNDYI